MGLGAAIRDYLHVKNISIKTLSEISGIPLNTLYSITKRDNVNVNLDILKRLSDALGVSIDRLVTYSINTDKGIIEPILYFDKKPSAPEQALLDQINNLPPEYKDKVKEYIKDCSEKNEMERMIRRFSYRNDEDK